MITNDPQTNTADAERIASRLLRAVQTACNDDDSELGTDRRARHSVRVFAMLEAAEFLRGDNDH